MRRVLLVSLLCVLTTVFVCGGARAVLQFNATKLSDLRLLGLLPPDGSSLSQSEPFWQRLRDLGRAIVLDLNSDLVVSPFSARGEMLIAYNSTSVLVRLKLNDTSLWAKVPVNSPWQDDSFEIWFDTLNDKTSGTNCNTGMNADDYKFLLTANGDLFGHIYDGSAYVRYPTSSIRNLFEKIGTLNDTADDVGFDAELHIPLLEFLSIGSDPEGTTMGFNVLLNDRDTSDTVVKGAAYWSPSPCGNNNPVNFGNLFFESASTETYTTAATTATTATGTDTIGVSRTTNTEEASTYTTTATIATTATGTTGRTGASRTTNSEETSTTSSTPTSGPTTSVLTQTTVTTHAGVILTPVSSLSDTAFPWLIVVLAVGCSVCCFVLVAVTFFAAKRRHRQESFDDGNLELQAQVTEDETESIYDHITQIVVNDLSSLRPANEVAADGHYARIPTLQAVVEGTYAQIPATVEAVGKSTHLSSVVTVLSAAEIMIDPKQRVGKGSYGDVFRGRYYDLDVAVKMLKNDFTQEQLKSFYDEAEVIARIPPHEFVVGFLGATPDPFLLVTEFCGQGSLYRYLRSNNTHPPSRMEAVKLVRDICAGMSHLASHGIVHRDLAARNVLLTNKLVVRIADFGLSRQVEEGVHQTKSTTGPARWMAPEFIRKGISSEKSDVWSAGVTAWEIFHGAATPYGRDLPNMRVIQSVLAGERLQFLDSVPDMLVDLFGRCMAADPANRPSFAEIVEELDAGDHGVIYAPLGSFMTLETANGSSFH